MPHTRDVQGREWSACDHCPHPTPSSCPSRRHRRYCELAASGPAGAALVAREPAEDRPGREIGSDRIPFGTPPPPARLGRQSGRADSSHSSHSSPPVAPRPPALPPAFAASPPSSRVVIRAHLYAHGGYGQIAEWLGRGLEGLGIPVAYRPIVGERQFLPLQPFVADRLVEDHPPGDPWELLLTVPHGTPDRGRHAAFFSMWEVDRLRDGSVAGLNAARLVIVPCRWNAEVFRAEGVTVPVRVVPLGIDPALGWRYHPVPSDGPTAFGTAGRLAHGGDRKGVATAIRAFRDAFPRGDEDVRLRVKVIEDDLSKLGDLAGSDPRVSVHARPLPEREMADWSRACHVGVFATCGEGWGLHVHQFLALGRPVVAPMATAIPDYCDPAAAFPVDWDWRPARDFYGDTGGRWAEPRYASLVRQMRAAHGSRGEVARRGRIAAETAGRFTWRRTARELFAALAGAGMIAGPMREDVRARREATEAARTCPERYEAERSCQCHARCRRLGGRRLSLSECVAERMGEESICPDPTAPARP